MQVANTEETLNGKPPEVGCFKLKVDVAVVPTVTSFAVGMVLRDHNGVYQRGKLIIYDREVTVLEDEYVGIEEALSWIMSRKVLIESDSLLVVQAINKGYIYQSEV